MPTVLEVLRPDGVWVRYARIEPGQIGGSMSDRSSGRREIIHFRCEPDDSHTTIERSAGGADYEMDDKRVTLSLGLEPLKEVYPGETHNMIVLADRTDTPRHIRIRHERTSNAT